MFTSFTALIAFLGIAHNIILICIFYSRRKNNWDIVHKFGILYLFLSIPAIIALIYAIQGEKESYFPIFLTIFLVYLGIEALFDFILKIEFRENWKLLVPYLIGYYIVNYGFWVMNAKESAVLGNIVLVLLIIQLIANALSHRKENTEPNIDASG